MAAAAELLLAHLSLLFVPVGVGVISHLQLVSQYGLQLLAVIVLSTWIGLAMTALVLRRLLRSGSQATTGRKAMTDFVQLWVYLSATPLFGLTATLVTYVVAAALYARLDRAPWANPVLWSVVCLGCVLVGTGTPYPTYFAGAQFVHVLLGPAVVALAWPLWQRRARSASAA